MSNFKISNVGSTIGAMAVGPGAKATGTVNVGGAASKEPAGTVSVSVEIVDATEAQADDWLKKVRKAVVDGRNTRIADNTASNGAKLAYSIRVN